jgi:hypothetical protein
MEKREIGYCIMNHVLLITGSRLAWDKILTSDTF